MMARRRRSEDDVLKALIKVILIGLLLPIYLIKLIINAIIRMHRKRKQKSAMAMSNALNMSMEKIDALDGINFERFVAGLLRSNGYTDVKTTKASGDYGVDITARKDNKVWAFQCKCYQSNVGLKPVQEVYSGARKYNANVAVAVTNRYFTDNAKVLANDIGVVLWDRNTIARMIKQQNQRRGKIMQTERGL